MRHKIFFRADGSSQIGLGHIFRTLALVDMLKEVFSCTVLIQAPSLHLVTLIERVATLEILPSRSVDENEAQYIVANYLTGNEVIVLDGYQFSINYQKALKAKETKLVCIDDIHTCDFVADAIINHAGGVLSKDYNSSFYTQFYLGFQYLLLRKSFLETAKQVVKYQVNSNLLVCMGGADLNNDTIKILSLIEQNNSVGITCHVIIGGAYEHQEKLNIFIENSSLDIQVHSNLSELEMLDCMNQCGMAVLPPSTVSLEYLCSKGELYVYQTADNQEKIKKYLLDTSLALDFKKDYPSTQGKILVQNQAEVIDGNSPERLQKLFQRLITETKITVREAREEDLMQYFVWANDPAVRNNSFSSKPIVLEDHTAWFNKRVQSEDTLLLIFFNNENPIGQVRFQQNNDRNALINYSVDSNVHGQGYGFTILKLGILHAMQHGFNNRFIGKVKPENIASKRIFEKLSFQEQFDENEGCFIYELNNKG